MEFVDLNDISQHEICGSVITWREMEHPGKSYSFRLEYEGKSVIYATDVEYKNLSKESLSPIVEFFKGADLLIFDSQYTLLRGLKKKIGGIAQPSLALTLLWRLG